MNSIEGYHRLSSSKAFRREAIAGTYEFGIREEQYNPTYYIEFSKVGGRTLNSVASIFRFTYKEILPEDLTVDIRVFEDFQRSISELGFWEWQPLGKHRPVLDAARIIGGRDGKVYVSFKGLPRVGDVNESDPRAPLAKKFKRDLNKYLFENQLAVLPSDIV